MKDDKLMKKLGSVIEQQLNAEPNPYVNNFSSSLKEELMQTMIMEDEKYSKRRKNRRTKKMLQICVIILICLIAVPIAFPETVDAVKKYILKVSIDEEKGAINFANTEQQQALAEWSGYWYPEYLPDRYSLAYVSDEETGFMSFTSPDSDEEISINQIPIESSVTTHNKENTEIRKVVINNYEGYLFINPVKNYVTLQIETSTKIVIIMIRNTADDKIILKIARNLKFIE